MGYNGSGGYTRVHNWVNDKNGAIKITASRMDAEFDDFASAMELCLLKDGQQNPTANLPMNAKKHTGVAAASARTDYADVASYQDGKFVWAGLASGASAIALTMNPTITAYTTGMRIGFVAVGDNASAVTINVDGVSAAAGVKGKADALIATDIISGGAYWITYKGADGFQFDNLLEENPTFVTLTTTGEATIGGDVTISGVLNAISTANFHADVSISGALAVVGGATVSGKAVFASAVSVAGAFIHADNTYPASAGLANDIIITDGAGGLVFDKIGALWTNTGTIDLTTGSPTSVALASGLVGVSEIEIFINGFSTDTDNQAPMIQIGDSGGLEATGYAGYTMSTNGLADNTDSHSTGFFIGPEAVFDTADTTNALRLRLLHMGSNLWVCEGGGYNLNGANSQMLVSVGNKTLSGVLDRVYVTTSGGTAVFDNGTAVVRSR